MARVDPYATAVHRISERNGQLYLTASPGDSSIAVTVRYLRPLTATSEIVFLDEQGREVATMRGVDALSPRQRQHVEDALRRSYHLPTIVRVRSVKFRLGTRYLKVDTDQGQRHFALREPGRNVMWLTDGHLLIRDTAGGRYEIADLPSLDTYSRRLVERFL